MQEIKFRGRDKFGTWHYGCYTYAEPVEEVGFEGRHIIHEDFLFDAYPETIGQFIGLKDKYSKDAYCGDIFEDSKGVRRTIFYVEGGFVCESNPISFGYGSQGNSNPIEALADQQIASWFNGTCTIIGNIYDNPELLTK